MKRASISQAKNSLSRLIKSAQAGETIVICERDIPVARLEGIRDFEISGFGQIASLASRGLISLPQHQLDVKEYLERRRARVDSGSSAVGALIEERSQGR